MSQLSSNDFEYNRLINCQFKTMHSYNNEMKIKEAEQPMDTVSFIVWDRFRSEPPSFLCSSWDGFLRYYQISLRGGYNDEANRLCEVFLQHPVLCCDIGEGGIAFAGLASGDVMAVNLSNGTIVHLGFHEAPICGVFWVKEFELLISFGFDQCIKFWSLKAQGNNYCLQTVSLPIKTHTVSFDYPFVLIGSIDSTVSIISLRDLPSIKIKPYEMTRLEKMSKMISSTINAQSKKGMIGTCDGRTLLFEFIDNYDIKMENSFVARSQKKSVGGSGRSSISGHVNTVELGYANYESFSIFGGSEDLVIHNIKKRTKAKTVTTSGYSTGATTACRISEDAKYLAYATGTDWLKGLEELENLKKPKINVIKLTSSELRQFTARS